MTAYIIAYFVVGFVVSWDFLTEPTRKTAAEYRESNNLGALSWVLFAKVFLSVVMSPAWPFWLMCEIINWRSKKNASK